MSTKNKNFNLPDNKHPDFNTFINIARSLISDGHYEQKVFDPDTLDKKELWELIRTDPETVSGNFSYHIDGKLVLETKLSPIANEFLSSLYSKDFETMFSLVENFRLLRLDYEFSTYIENNCNFTDFVNISSLISKQLNSFLLSLPKKLAKLKALKPDEKSEALRDLRNETPEIKMLSLFLKTISTTATPDELKQIHPICTSLFKNIFDIFTQVSNGDRDITIYYQAKGILSLYQAGLYRHLTLDNQSGFQQLVQNYISLPDYVTGRRDSFSHEMPINQLLLRSEEYSKIPEPSHKEKAIGSLWLLGTLTDKQIDDFLSDDSKYSTPFFYDTSMFEISMSNKWDIREFSDKQLSLFQMMSAQTTADFSSLISDASSLNHFLKFSTLIQTDNNNYNQFNKIIQFIISEKNAPFLFKPNLKDKEIIAFKQTVLENYSKFSNKGSALIFKTTLFSNDELVKIFQQQCSGWWNHNFSLFADAFFQNTNPTIHPKLSKIITDSAINSKEIASYLVAKKAKENPLVEKVLKSRFSNDSKINRYETLIKTHFPILEKAIISHSAYPESTLIDCFREATFSPDQNDDKEYLINDTLFNGFLSVLSAKTIPDKINAIKPWYNEYRIFQKTNNKDVVSLNELQFITSLIFPNSKSYNWFANKLSDNNWYNIKRDNSRWGNSEKKDAPFTKVFMKKDVQFVTKLQPYLDSIDYGIGFDITDGIIDLFYKLEKIPFAQRKEEITKLETADYAKRNDYSHKKSLHPMLSWILLYNRLPRDSKLFDKVDMVSTFDLKEFNIFNSSYENLANSANSIPMEAFYQKLDTDSKTYGTFNYLREFHPAAFATLDKSDNKTLDLLMPLIPTNEHDSLKKYITKTNFESTFSKFTMFEFYGKHFKIVAEKAIKDELYSLLPSYDKPNPKLSKFAQSKMFEATNPLSSSVSIQKLFRYTDVIGLIEVASKRAIVTADHIEMLKMLLDMSTNTSTLTIQEFETYVLSYFTDEKAGTQIYNDLIDINNNMNTRFESSYVETIIDFGDGVFKYPIQHLKSHKFDLEIEQSLLSNNGKKIFDRFNVKHSSSYLSKSIYFEINSELLRAEKNYFNSFFPRHLIIETKKITETPNQVAQKLRLEIEVLETKLNDFTQKTVDKRKEFGDEGDIMRKFRPESSYETPELLSISQQRVSELSQTIDAKIALMDKIIDKNSNELYDLDEDVYDLRKDLDKFEFLLGVSQIKTEITQTQSKLDAVDFGTGEIKILTDAETKKLLFAVINHKNLFHKQIMKLLIDNNLDYTTFSDVSQGINVHESIQNQLDILTNEFASFQNFPLEFQTLDIYKTLLFNYQNKITQKQDELFGISHTNSEFSYEILTADKLDFYHVNRQNGMLNCLSINDAAEVNLFHTANDPSKTAMFVVKDTETGNYIFSSYLAVLENELLIDNIEGNKLFYDVGVKAYQHFVKSTLSHLAREFKTSGKPRLSKITMSNQYSKIKAVNLNKDAKVLTEFSPTIPNIYSDALTSRIEIFNIANFFVENEKQLDASIKSLKLSSIQNGGEVEYIQTKIKEFLKNTKQTKITSTKGAK